MEFRRTKAGHNFWQVYGVGELRHDVFGTVEKVDGGWLAVPKGSKSKVVSRLVDGCQFVADEFQRLHAVPGSVVLDGAVYVEEACEVMHDAYERAAVVHGWDTNPAAKHKPWSEVPETNKATMRDAMRALLQWQKAVKG